MGKTGNYVKLDQTAKSGKTSKPGKSGKLCKTEQTIKNL